MEEVEEVEAAEETVRVEGSTFPSKNLNNGIGESTPFVSVPLDAREEERVEDSDDVVLSLCPSATVVKGGAATATATARRLMVFSNVSSNF